VVHRRAVNRQKDLSDRQPAGRFQSRDGQAEHGVGVAQVGLDVIPDEVAIIGRDASGQGELVVGHCGLSVFTKWPGITVTVHIIAVPLDCMSPQFRALSR
jgi:hypothetical protein